MKSENEIPKFDLSDQILSGQRKFASIKRTAPTRKRISKRNIESNLNDNKSKTIPDPITVPENDNSTDQIISEIVARDIHNLRMR